ncbi:MAG: metallophosphoesterase [Lachnospiraceae bacterium]|nr:metallophosphoesterase [Lachnospiraceae bacterium]
MNVKMAIIFGTVMLLTMGLISFTYYRLLIRFVSLFNKKERKDYGKRIKAIYIILSVVMTSLTVNFFSVVGIVLAHFIVISWIIELVNIVVKFLFSDKNLNIWNCIIKSLIIPLICTVAIVIYGYINMHNVVRTEYIIHSNEVSEEYKIVFISDVHYGTIVADEEIDKAIDRINKENADIIILGGDMVDESTSKEDILEAYNKLSKLKAKLGVYHVEGNHDRQKYSDSPTLSDDEYEELKNGLDIVFLEDDSIQVNNEILVAGRLDVSNQNRISENELLYGIDQSQFVIVADHQPVNYKEESKAGANLVVSGHTHAGQIFPIGLFTTLVGGAEQNYGLKLEDNTVCIVSSGLVGWGYPIRTSKNCEYVVINLKP